MSRYAWTFAVGTPYSRVGASEGYLESVVALAEAWGRDAYYHGYMVEAGSSYGQQRNRLVARFLQTEASWLLHLDDDIRFPVDIVANLLEPPTPETARVVVGVVPVGFGQPSNVYGHPDCLALDPVDIDAQTQTPVQLIRGFGGAIHIVHRSVYEEMARRFGWLGWYSCWSDVVPGAPGGAPAIRELEPDLSFARRLIVMGIEAWARFDLPVTHSKPLELKR